MNNIFFSIVVPTYNRADYIIQLITSFLGQTYTNFEIILVDDGSTDPTEKVVKTIKDNRIRYYKKENGERGVARNYGAKLAKGRYVNFFDSDDMAYPHHLSEAIKMIEKYNNPEIFHLGYDLKNTQNQIIKKKMVKDVNYQLIKGNCLSCNGVFIRTDIALKHPFSTIRELSASEDYLLWIKLAARYTIHSYLGVTSTIFDHNNRSVLEINTKKLINRQEMMLSKMFLDEEVIKKYNKNKFQITENIYSYISLHIAISKVNKKIALKYLFKSIYASPIFIFKKRFFAIIKHLIF